MNAHSKIPATQADRDAAASAYFAWIGSNPVIPNRMRAGEADDHSMVQAFARHRLGAISKVSGACTGADWIQWAGGECPVRGQRVDVRYRSGLICTDKLADDLSSKIPDECCWHHRAIVQDGGGSDIVAYRVVQS